MTSHGCHGVSNHRQLDCLFNILLRLKFNNHCGGFPSNKTSNAENVLISWRHHGVLAYHTCTMYICWGAGAQHKAFHIWTPTVQVMDCIVAWCLNTCSVPRDVIFNVPQLTRIDLGYMESNTYHKNDKMIISFFCSAVFKWMANLKIPLSLSLQKIRFMQLYFFSNIAVCSIFSNRDHLKKDILFVEKMDVFVVNSFQLKSWHPATKMAIRERLIGPCSWCFKPRPKL